VNRACSGHLPNRSMTGGQREPVCCLCHPSEPAMERVMRSVAFALMVLGTAAGLWEHWLA